MEKILVIVICALCLSITSTYCCLLSGSSGSCLASRLTFGGRLTFPEGTPDNLPCNGEINGQKIIIFQKPRNFGKGKTIRSMFGKFGVGRIWISGGKTCQKPTGQDNLQCPVPERQKKPCLDDNIPCPLVITPGCGPTVNCTEDSNDIITCTVTGIPPGVNGSEITGYRVQYKKVGDPDSELKTEEFSVNEQTHLAGPFEEGYTYEMWISFKYGTSYGKPEVYDTFVVPCRDVELNLRLFTTSRRVGMASIVANWTVREVTGPCYSASKEITIKQMDLDNCGGMQVPTPETHALNDDDRSYRLREKNANTEYHVTVTVSTDHQKYTASQVIRTNETAPSAHPENVAMHSYKRSRWLDIRWDELPCGKRNGKMHSYSIRMTRGGVTRVHNVKGKRARYAGFSIGEEFTIQIAAINSRGMGPYCPEVRGSFGKDDTLTTV